MSYIKELGNVPELDLMNGITLESLKAQMTSDYAHKYESITGKVADLKETDPDMMMINSFALIVYQLIALSDTQFKQNFLRYAEGPSLDHLGAFKGIGREQPMPAKTMLKFTLSDARPEVISIPGGTRVCTASEVVFVTDEYTEIPPGEMEITVGSTAEIAGTGSNGYPSGTVTEIMDTIPFLETVTNTQSTYGGKDIQSDADYTLDIYKAPKGTSMGGPEDAYETKAYKLGAEIYDVKAVSPDPCYVDIYFTVNSGETPDAEMLAKMGEYFSPKDMRPMGDRVSAKAPTEIDYSIDLSYYIASEDAASEEVIKERVTTAISEYKSWQRRIGKDINPSELIRRVMSAGAKRVELTVPNFTTISADTVDGVQISKLISETINYGGVEA